MKKTAFVLFFIVCFLGILRTTYPDGLYSRFIKEYEIVQDQAIYSVGWTRKIKGPILDMIMVEIDVTKKEAKKLGVKGLDQCNSSDKIKIQYPKVVMLAHLDEKYKELTKTIKFFNKKGKIKKNVELNVPTEQCLLSPNKKLVGIRKFYTRDLIIYNLDGIKQNKFKVKPLSSIKLADDGSFVIYGCGIGDVLGNGSINFYNSKGLLVKEVKELHFLHRAKLTFDNKYLIVLACGDMIKNDTKKMPVNKKYPTNIYCYNKDGNLIWMYIIEDMTPNGLSNNYYTYPFEQLEITKDSKKIIIRGNSRTKKIKMKWVFSIDGKLLETKEGW